MGVRVLFVDDDVHVGRAYRRALRGHDVDVVVDPRVARDRIAAGERFDVIVSDLVMPGMTGAELHDAIATIDADQARRMVFVTGGTRSRALEAFIASTTQPVLAKPVDVAALEAAMEAVTRDA